MSTRAFLGAFLAVCISGCGEETPSPNEPVGAEDELTSSTAIRFECKEPSSTDADLVVTIGKTGQKLSLVLGLENQVVDKGALDVAYQPREGNKDYRRFTGFPALREDGAGTGEVMLLVEKSMFERKAGHVKLQQRGDDFVQTLYTCTP